MLGSVYLVYQGELTVFGMGSRLRAWLKAAFSTKRSVICPPFFTVAIAFKL